MHIASSDGDAPGMVMLKVKGVSSEEVVDTLYRKYGIATTEKNEEKGFRVSVSPFNTLREIEKLNNTLYELGYSRDFDKHL